MRYLSLLLIPLLLALAAVPGAALPAALPEPAGRVTTLRGEAWLQGRGPESAVHHGQAILPGMLLRTGARAGVGVLLSDGTRLGLGPHSEFVLDDYRFDPARGEFRLAASLSRGSLSLTSGSIGRLDPRGIRLNTPDGQVRVRDAQALLRVGP